MLGLTSKNTRSAEPSLGILGIKLFKKIVRLSFSNLFPYLATAKLTDSATVLKKIDPQEAYKAGLRPGYYFLIKVEWYRDCQTMYSSDYTERRGYLRVSQKYFNYAYTGHSLTVTYQRSRISTSRKIRCWITR